MKTRVLVVDDSKFFRRRVTEIINANPDMEVVGAAENGTQAIDLAAKLKPDVITMDIEMPVMDGITAVRKIMALKPVPIVMFSSLTTDGAKATLDALDAGAADFLPKKFEDIAKDKEEAKRMLCEKIRSLVRGGASHPAPAARPEKKVTATSAASAPKSSYTLDGKPAPMPPSPALAPSRQPVTVNSRPPLKGPVKLVAIGTSTGGPVALQKVLAALPKNFPVPVIVVQHMPGTFTPAFSQRLDQMCKVSVKQAETGDVLKPGSVYIAPGGQQLILDPRATVPTLKVIDGDSTQNYKPCVDVTFNSINERFSGKVLAVIMTGMGADGREGARALKAKGAEVWAQDEKTCVVYGMPAAVVEAGLTDRVYPLDNIGEYIVQKVM